MSGATEIQNPKTKQRLSSTQVLILLGLVLINLVIFGAMWLMSQGTDSVSRSPVLTMGEPLELHGSFEKAMALASNWHADAQLVGATTSWQMASGDQLTLHRPAWSFSFYSPAARQVKVVIVDERGAQGGRQQPTVTAPQSVNSDWSMGSDDLLLTFLSYGGQTFIDEHPNSNIHFQLKTDDAKRSIWYITCLDPVARQSLLMGVDALSRQVILNETAGGDA